MLTTPNPRGKKPTLLLVDDNRDLLTFLTTFIENEGWIVCYAESAVRARTIFAEDHIDAALLDQNLPDGTGVRLALELRSRAPTLPICIMSGDILSDQIEQVAKENQLFIRQKPFLARHILEALQNTLRHQDGFLKPLGMVEVFFSYSHEDEEIRDELERHLSALKRNGLIHGWYDRKIVPGEDINRAIDDALERADLILLLISSDFIASDYCYSKELRRAMERHDGGRARVIPIIVRPVDWATCIFGGLKALPRDGKPVTSWARRDAALLDVARGIRSAAEELSKKRPGK